MSRTFAYVRVSTIQQTIKNQVRELEMAGFAIPKRRIVSETISGSVPAQQRPMFARLVDRLEGGMCWWSRRWAASGATRWT